MPPVLCNLLNRGLDPDATPAETLERIRVLNITFPTSMAPGLASVAPTSVLGRLPGFGRKD